MSLREKKIKQIFFPNFIENRRKTSFRRKNEKTFVFVRCELFERRKSDLYAKIDKKNKKNRENFRLSTRKNLERAERARDEFSH